MCVVRVVAMYTKKAKINVFEKIFFTLEDRIIQKKKKKKSKTIDFSFFQILWKRKYYILVTFPSHLKKLRSILRFWLKELNCGFCHSFHSWKTPQNKFSCQNFSVENNYCLLFTSFLIHFWQLCSLDILAAGLPDYGVVINNKQMACLQIFVSQQLLFFFQDIWIQCRMWRIVGPVEQIFDSTEMSVISRDLWVHLMLMLCCVSQIIHTVSMILYYLTKS